MYCPKCGREGSDAQNFCRSCGLDFRRVSKALDTEFTADELEPSTAESDRRIARLAVLAAAVLFAGIVAAIVGKKITHDDTLVGIGAIVAIFAMFMLIGPLIAQDFARRSALRKKADAKAPVRTKQLMSPADRFSVPMPSVTEGTTRKLAVDRQESSGELSA